MHRNPPLARWIRWAWTLALVAWALWLVDVRWLHLTPRGAVEFAVTLHAGDSGLASVEARATGAARAALSDSERDLESNSAALLASGGARSDYVARIAPAERAGTGTGAWSSPRLVRGSALFPFVSPAACELRASVRFELPEGLASRWLGVDGPRLADLRAGALLVAPRDQLVGRRAGEALRLFDGEDGACTLPNALRRWCDALDLLLPPSRRPLEVLAVHDAPANAPIPLFTEGAHLVVPLAGSDAASRERFVEALARARLGARAPLPVELEWLDAGIARRIALAGAAREVERWRDLFARAVFLAPSYDAPLTRASSAEGDARDFLERLKAPLLLRAVELRSSDARDSLRRVRDWLAARDALAAGEELGRAIGSALGSEAALRFGELASPAATLDASPFGEVPALRASPATAEGGANERALRLALTADTENFLETCGCRLRQAGGLARRARLLERARERGPLVALDLGNLFPRLERESFDALALGEVGLQLAADRRMGYALHALGPNELYAGMDRLAAASDAASMRFACVNARLASGAEPPWSREPVSIECAGVRWFVVPLAPTTPYWIDDAELARRAPEVVIEDPIESVRRACERARPEDLVLVAGSIPTWRLAELLRAVPSIDLVVSSDLRALPARPGARKRGIPSLLDSGFLGDVPIVLANEESHGLTFVELSIDPAGRVRAFRQEDVLLAPDLEEDPEVRALLDDFYAGLESSGPESARATPLAALASERALVEPRPDAPSAYVGSQTCAECHALDHERWKATPHAGAMRTLEEAHRARSPGCVRCHSVGYGLPGGYSVRGGEALRALRDVGCESCHGPGRAHAIDRPGDPNAIRRGLALADCERCHDAEHSEPLAGRARDPFELGAHRLDPRAIGALR